MRGIIAEINDKYAVVLCQDGSFRTLKATADMTVGNETELSQTTRDVKVIRLVTKVASFAAAAMLTLGLGYGAYSYTVPYSYVDIDINPSIELTVNVYDRIIKAEALNDDGEILINNSSLKNARLETGVLQLINNATKQGYLRADPVTTNAVILTVSSSDSVKSKKLKKSLMQITTKELNIGSVKSEVLVGEASIKQLEDAKKLGVTPGKFAFIEDAIEDDPELELEDLKKATVKELIEKARNKKDAKIEQVYIEVEDSDTDESKSNKIEQDEENVKVENGVKQKESGVQRNTPESKDIKGAIDSKLSKDGDDGKKKQGKGNDEGKPDNGDDGGERNKEKDGERNKENGEDDGERNKENGDEEKKQNSADRFQHEKKHRQQLRDELLEQMKESKHEWDEEKLDKGQQTKENGERTEKHGD